jgi:hypothetical protein
LTACVKADLEVWKVALENQRIEVPWIDHLFLSQNDFDFYTDASGKAEKGCGVYLQGEWCSLQWPPGYVITGHANMLLLEMIPVAIAIETFLDRFESRRIRVFSDNEGVVFSLNRASCECPDTMPLIRLIFLRSIQKNFRLTAKYIHTKENTKADNLSRLQMDEFRQEVPEASPTPFQPPSHLWPPSSQKLKALRLRELNPPPNQHT